MIDESKNTSRIKSGRTCVIIKKEGDRRMDKEKESGEVFMELREIRKMMEELWKYHR